jgi:hypothetical protein
MDVTIFLTLDVGAGLGFSATGPSADISNACICHLMVHFDFVTENMLH